eukprot:TRINITY_DN13131_c0_g1_i3.p1 TRINITY_DN13131_c0_g1~~TRINITY_DN13131_c0_g1_i3.p1  ORF type:complete len:137 (+),score=16.48 TRINITY_DN13131_c0_g1_i3:77-487(+)
MCIRDRVSTQSTWGKMLIIDSIRRWTRACIALIAGLTLLALVVLYLALTIQGLFEIKYYISMFQVITTIVLVSVLAWAIYRSSTTLMLSYLICMCTLSLGCGIITLLIELSRFYNCLLYTSPSPRDRQKSRMPSSA